MIDDGVIKYDRSNFTYSGPLDESLWKDLELWRAKLYSLNLIGEYPTEKVGFGNVSQFIAKQEQVSFVITGTQTGKYAQLDGSLYTIIEGYDLKNMKLFSRGSVEPSSEALTHASIYEANDSIKAVFHIHNTRIWKGMIDNDYPATHEDIPYGTLEMATNVQRIIGDSTHGTIVMKGHQDGVIAYATNLDSCGDLILQLAKKFL
ncbi:class II aldolase/adducin family protein [Halobacteriovorax sp. HLS]|uniref:class II aldolase/adducin family protein n=1 Tax=Halobacteriovorax sp. HLS TaxID=2234000 RepID=UPI000FD7D52A|nr:class II aldolase/adducin family protein [Halobacteriovorax sp. HLS]